MIVVVEIQAAIDAAGTLQTFLFSSEGWTTLPTDTPANTHVSPRLIQAANYKRDLFSGARTFGPVTAAYGECKLANLDGGLDTFARYGFGGRRYTVRMGEPGAAYPSEFTTVLTATMKVALRDLTETSGAVRIILRDRLADLEKPLASEVYAATGGAEGTATAVSGVRKPVAFGTTFGCKPQLIDENFLIYALGAAPTGYGTLAMILRDGGADLVPEAGAFDETANYAALVATPVTAGKFARCSAEGLIKIGLKPTFELTCSSWVTDVATHTDTTPALPGNILRDMALAVGIDSGDINSTDVTTVNTARTADYGYRVASDETALSAMGKIANSASIWIGFDSLGVLRMGIFDAPSGTSAYTFSHRNGTKIQQLDTAETSIPIWKVTARSSFNGAPQTTFSGSMPAWYSQWFDKEWPLQTVAEDATVKDKHPNAPEMMVDVYTGDTATRVDDAGEAARRLALYGVEREAVQITTPVTLAMLAAVDLGVVVTLQYPRFGWDAGKLMRVVAIAINFDAMRAEITLWG